MRDRIYKALIKAQNLCYDVGEDKLFDMCEYHIDIIDSEHLTKADLLQILKFAQDVRQMAKIRGGLEPLV